MTFDPTERAFYASSLQGGSIVRIAASGEESIFRAADNRASLIGIKVDAVARRLWVCAADVDNINSQVWVFDLQSGELATRFQLGALATNGTCNDLTLDKSGVAYVTDPSKPNIYRLDPVTEQGSVFASDPLLADSLDINLGNNGIVISGDQSTLIVAKFAPAQLIRISISEPGAVSAITLDGDDLPNPDGLIFVGDDLYAVSSNSVSRIQLNQDFSQGTVHKRPQIDGLSTATESEGRLYAIKSDVVNFVTGHELNLPFEIFRVDLAEFEQ